MAEATSFFRDSRDMGARERIGPGIIDSPSALCEGPRSTWKNHVRPMTQFVKSADGLDIAHEIMGNGKPIILIHGFASDSVQNWRAPRWYTTLNEAGYRVVALDCRGHGESSKPYDPTYYTNDLMEADVVAAMDAENITTSDVMGYSM